MKSIEQINKEIYLYSNKEVPFALLCCLAEKISNYNPSFAENGKVGLLGITYEQSLKAGKNHIQMFDTKMNLEAGSKELKRLVNEARSKYPAASLEQWYLYSLSAFLNGGKIGVVNERAINIWEECRDKVIKKS